MLYEETMVRRPLQNGYKGNIPVVRIGVWGTLREGSSRDGNQTEDEPSEHLGQRRAKMDGGFRRNGSEYITWQGTEPGLLNGEEHPLAHD